MLRRTTPRLLMTAMMAVLLTSVSSAQYQKSDPSQQKSDAARPQKANFAQQSHIEVPSHLALLIMIKTTLIAFNDANASGNYTVLRDLASPEFQQTNTSATLAKIFERERERKIDISAIVVLQPTLLRPAFIDNSGLLWLVGFFSSSPTWVNFKLAFKPVAGRWKLEALGVVTGETKVAAAPAPTRSGQAATFNDIFQQRGSAMNEIVPATWPTQAVKASDHSGYLGFMNRDHLGYFK